MIQSMSCTCGLRNRVLVIWLVIMMLTVGFSVVTQEAKADTGGPDIEGYYWTDSNLPAPTVPFNWIDGITGGTPLGLWDDEYVGPIPLGFTFNYYGLACDEVYISSNGFIAFTDPGTSWPDWPPSTNMPNNEIVPFGDDLDPGAGGEIYYKFIPGTPDKFVVTWDAVPYCGNPSEQTFQIVLNETGEIWLNYLIFTDPGWWPTIGIENNDGTVGLNYPNGPANNLAIRFGPPHYSYDIAVECFQAPDVSIPNELIYVNATIRNRGDFTENNIEVNFTVNGTLQGQTTIPSLASQAISNVGFTYTPPAEENYTVEIRVTPITNEIFVQNNQRSKDVMVYVPRAYLLIDQAHGNDLMDYNNFIQDQWDQRYWVNYTSNPLDAAILANHTVLISIRPWNAYSASELAAVRDFLNGTGGLMVIGGSNQNVLNGLTDYSGITWNGPQAGNTYTTTTNIGSHPTTTGINMVYYTWSWMSLEISGKATGVLYDSDDLTIQGAASRYNFGKVFAENSRDDFNNWALSNGDNLQYSRNIIKWLATPPEAHDLTVMNLSAPDYAISGDNINITATIVNTGLNAEAGIIVNFTVNGTLQDFRNIANIAPLERVNVDFGWTPPAEENYTVEISVTTVPGETNTVDNNAPKVVYAYQPVAYLLIDRAHNNDLSNYNNFIQDQRDQKYWVNYTSDPLNTTILANHDILISIRPGNAYSASELAAVRDFLNGTGGLMVIGGSNQNVLNGLTDYSGITWNGPQAGSTYTTTTNIASHPTTTGINTVYYTWSSFSIDTSGSATGVLYDSDDLTTQGAAATYNFGKVFAENSRDDFNNWNLFNLDNHQYSRNIVNWLLTPPESHDIAVTNLSVPSYAITGDSINITATIVNNGLNAESNITVNFTVDGILQDFRSIANIASLELVNVDFLWTPPAEANYTVEINANIVPGETNTLDNNASKVVYAYHPVAYLLIDRAHNNDLSNYNNFIQDQRDQKYWVNYTSDPLNSTILANHDVLISIRPWIAYSASELAAVRDFLNGTGGLMVIGGTNQNVLNGLTDYSGITWNGPQAGSLYTTTMNIASHPTTTGINTVYYTWSTFSIDTAGGAIDVIHDNANITTQGAAATYNFGKIFAENSRNDFDNWRLNNWDNRQYSRNIMAWLLEPMNGVQVYGVDLAPPTAQRSQAVTMLALNISTTSGNSNLSSLSVMLTGNATDSDIASVKLYHDADGDMALSPADYQIGTTELFSSKNATFSSLNYHIDTAVRTILVVYDISWNATLLANASCEISNNSFVGVDNPYMVSPFLPIASSNTSILADTTIPPRVQSTSPADGSTNVPRTTMATIAFNEPMNKTSVEGNITISGGRTATGFSWSNSDTTVNFSVTPPLSYDTIYNITLNGSAVMDMDGNLLDGNNNGTAEGSPIDDYSWSFTTELAPDTTPPESAAGALPVYTTSNILSISYTASDPTVIGQINSGLKEVELWYKNDSGVWTMYGTFTSSPISFDTSTTGGDGNYQFYTLARDNENNYESAPSGNDTWTIVDTTLPNADINSLAAYSATTSFAINATASDINGIGSVMLYYRVNGGSWKPYGIADTSSPYGWNFDTAPNGGDGFYEFYAVAYDMPGNCRILPVSSTNADASTTVDTAPPAATGAPTGMNISITANITATFSETVNHAQAEGALSILPDIVGSFVWNGNIMTFIPASPLAYGTEYNVTIDAADVVDMAGNHMINDKIWQFMTESAPPTETGSIEGSVVDENGNPVIGAAVTIDGFSTTTDENGTYSFTDVPVGDYTVIVKKSGYGDATATVTVLADQITTVPPLELMPRTGLPSWLWIVFLMIILVIGITLAGLKHNSKKQREVNKGEIEEQPIEPMGESVQPDYNEPISPGDSNVPPPPPAT